MLPCQQKRSALIKEKHKLSLLFLCVFFIVNFGCGERSDPVASKFTDIKPAYTNIHLEVEDTLHFKLVEGAYNKIKSFNYFIADNGASCISFYDRLSESVVIYDFASQKPLKKIKLKKIIKGDKFYKTSVYVKNYDSLYITNFDKLYLLDSAGKIKRKITFNNVETMAFFETPLPVVTKGHSTIMGVHPFVSEKSLSDIKDWKVLCDFDLDKGSCDLRYSLPRVYRKGLYGRRFMQFSYCYNDKNNLVFSFPADPNIYETDLADYHVAYNGKSRFQNAPIEPVSKAALEKDEGGKEYALRDSYGPIYYDTNKKRYLRIAKQKLSPEEFASKTVQRKVSIIVFDQQFKIIGEFLCNNDYLLDTIFFTSDGGVYAQANVKDENALHFVRLAWKDDRSESLQLTKK